MDLANRYQEALAKHGFEPDRAQQRTVRVLARVARDLEHASSAGLLHYLDRLLGRRPNASVIKGAYLWGGVGRGKTFLMDLFFDHLSFEHKTRFHFHRFMNRVHARLKEVNDLPDPLSSVAGQLASDARVICLDEFFVSDIADAMILGKLFESLFARNVALVATSNIPPKDLYADGLQRQRFLPAIDLLERHTEIVHVDGTDDYRLRVLEQAEIYHAPLDDAADQNLEIYFDRIAPDTGTRHEKIEILGRDIPTRRRADGIAWFDFDTLCDGPRSPDDYIEIARCFQTVIVSDVPELTRLKEDPARRFVALVDEFYDRRVKLIISAATDIDALYSGSRLVREFERTRSRLIEMQSHQYLAAAHVP